MCTPLSLLTTHSCLSKGLWEGVTALTIGRIPTFTPSRRRHLLSIPFFSLTTGEGCGSHPVSLGGGALFAIR